MKYLIVYAHPNPKSFNYAIFETIKNKLENAGHEVQIRDLYGMKYNPVLSAGDFAGLRGGNLPNDIVEEQKWVTWADRMVFIYPVWWTGMPAIMKGWFDRTFLYGFAYAFNSNGLVKLLTAKKAAIINTCGQPKEAYEKEMYRAMNLTSDTGIFDFCGIEVIHHEYFPSVVSADETTRKNYLKKVVEIAEKIMQ